VVRIQGPIGVVSAERRVLPEEGALQTGTSSPASMKRDEEFDALRDALIRLVIDEALRDAGGLEQSVNSRIDRAIASAISRVDQRSVSVDNALGEIRRQLRQIADSTQSLERRLIALDERYKTPRQGGSKATRSKSLEEGKPSSSRERSEEDEASIPLSARFSRSAWYLIAVLVFAGSCIVAWYAWNHFARGSPAPGEAPRLEPTDARSPANSSDLGIRSEPRSDAGRATSSDPIAAPESLSRRTKDESRK
jgi:hypothetical protein